MTTKKYWLQNMDSGVLIGRPQFMYPQAAGRRNQKQRDLGTRDRWMAEENMRCECENNGDLCNLCEAQEREK